MIDEKQLGDMSVLKLWAKLQELTIHRSESQTWLAFYKERMQAEEIKLAKMTKLRNRIQQLLEAKASPEELKDLMSWSLD